MDVPAIEKANKILKFEPIKKDEYDDPLWLLHLYGEEGRRESEDSQDRVKVIHSWEDMGLQI